MCRSFFALFFLSFRSLSRAQTVINGHVFTDALAIVDAPAIGTTFNAGSEIHLAIDVSGDGKLANWQQASIPGCSYDTRYDALEVYLVSSDTSTNLTVSTGPGLLTREQGSNVKHLNWSIPTCIRAGNYNLTIYESSHINGQAFFSITPLSLDIQNSRSSGGTCSTGMNTLELQPQSSAPPSINPWIGNKTQQSSVRSSGIMTVKSSLSSTLQDIITISSGSSAILPSGININTTRASCMASSSMTPPTTIVLPTETVTVIVVSPDIIQVTSIESITVTSTVMYSSGTANSTPTLFPVNSSQTRWTKSRLACLVGLWNIHLLYLAWVSL